MSLVSMTGYGRGEATAKGISVVVNVSSVNRKQLDVRISAPRSMNALESRIQEEVLKFASRGRITGEIQITSTGHDYSNAVKINHQLAEAYVKALRTSARKLKLKDDLEASRLFDFPGVVQWQTQNGDPEKTWPVVRKALREALGNLLNDRRREGQQLKKDLSTRAKKLTRLLTTIASKAPQVAGQHRKMLLTRIQDAGLDIDLKDERLLKEVVFYADRADITEEITRLKSHLKQAVTLLRSKEPAGRALDFLAQEIFREINTIGSKSSNTSIIQAVLGFKSELEKIREQVQNIE